MKNLMQIADQLAEDQGVAEPKLIKVDVQVRTGGNILPPSWSNSMRRLRDDEPKAETLRAPKERCGS